MSYKIIISLFLCIILLSCVSSNGVNNVKTSDQEILDSLDVLCDVGGVIFGIGANPTLAENRYWKLHMLIYGLSFEATETLLLDVNYLKRIYAFSVLCSRYTDSITSNHLSIYNDTTQVFAYKRGDIIPLGISVGEFAQIVFKGEMDIQKSKSRVSLVKAGISSFIINYAEYPETYMDLGFGELEEWGDDLDVVYKLWHYFQLQNNSGVVCEDSLYFTINSNFEVNLVENSVSRVIHSFKPNYGQWFSTYGRSLNLKDSTVLDLVK